MKIALLLILFCVSVVACSPSGTPNINADMKQFLAQNGLTSTDMKCSMLGNGVTPGPDGMCLLKLANVDANALISTMGLQQKTDTVVSWEPSGPDCWTRLDFHDQAVSKWYLSPANAPNLKMENGTRLAYFRLFYVPDKEAACISISYLN